MSQDFAIFILSHNRAQKIDTLNMLQKHSYSGRYYIVISEDDSQIEDYKKLVGVEHLLIFNKEEYFNRQDTFVRSESPIMSASLYARNYIIDVVKQMRLTHFVMADDDIRDIFFRFNSEGKMKQKRIGDIDEILKAMRDFLESSMKIGGLCLALDDGYFGGLNGNFSKGLTRRIFQFMMFKTSEEWIFTGVRCEDFILSITNINRLFFCIWNLSIETPKMSTNDGGIEYSKDIYYEPLFPMIVAPSGIYVLPNGKRRIQENRLLPKILNQSHKKV